MTIITYKAGVLAGDSCVSFEGTVFDLATKIRRLPRGVLYGAAGDADDRPLLHMLARLREPDDIPPLEQLAALPCSVSALLVFSKREVWTVDTGESATAMKVSAPFVALGSGAAIALGAMEAGASAQRAAEIACRLNVYCRPPVTTLKVSK